MTYRIEVRFDGDLTPDKVSSRDVGELIASIETMVEAIIIRDNPTFRLNPGDVILSLVAVESNSSHYVLASELERVVPAAYQLATTAINTNRYDLLPVRSIEAIRTVKKFSKKYNRSAELWERNGNTRLAAVVSPTTDINVSEAIYVEGRTTLYGFLTGVAGENPPRARLRLLDGTTFECHITDRKNLQVARQLGQRLYTDVGVRGNARWELRDDLVLDYFLIQEVTEFSSVPIEQALNSLREIAGVDYARVDDIEALINDLRGRDEEPE